MRKLLFLSMCLMAVGLSSCNIIGGVVAILAPAEKSEAKYVPPKDKKVLVLIDDRPERVSWEPVKRDLAEELCKQLIEHKLARETIAYDSVLDLRASEPKFGQMSVVAIGQKLGADLVLYVNITEFRLRDDPRSPVWQGRLQTRVRWVNANALNDDDARLWPRVIGSEGESPDPVIMPVKEDVSADYGGELAAKMAKKMADHIAKLFYTYELPRAGDKIGEDKMETE